MITRGVYSATCSILHDDYSLNVDATIAHAASTIENGLHGAIFFGSTGQSQLISTSEKKDLIAKIANHKLRKYFFLGTGCNSLKETVDLIKYSCKRYLSRYLEIVYILYWQVKQNLEIINALFIQFRHI